MPDNKDGDVTLGGVLLIGEWKHTCNPPHAEFHPRRYMQGGEMKTAGFSFDIGADEKEQGILDKIKGFVSSIFNFLTDNEAGEVAKKLDDALKKFKGHVQATWGGVEFKTPCKNGKREVGIRLCLDVSVILGAAATAGKKDVTGGGEINFSITLPWDWAVLKATCDCKEGQEDVMYDGVLSVPIAFQPVGIPSFSSSMGSGLATGLPVLGERSVPTSAAGSEIPGKTVRAKRLPASGKKAGRPG